MRTVIAGILVLAACSSSGDGPAADDPTAPRTLPFGPFEIAPGTEISDQCVQISLNNEQPLHVNTVELTTGPGFHHSNWFFVPEHVFPGEDGTYTCDDRNFDQVVAALYGGVFFAQSTQSPHEVQQFPAGHVVVIPPYSKLVSTVHLLNPTDAPITSTPVMELRPIAEADVTTRLAGISFENQALGLPPNMASEFSVECDFSERHNYLYGRDPDFNILYALAHYHELGTALKIEAVKPDGQATTVFTTATAVGDSMGGPIAPAFSMAGYTKLRMTCEYYNPRAQTVRWGIGDQEMCVFLAFSDSDYNWGGGVHSREAPQNGQLVGNTMTYSNLCALFASERNQ